MPPSDNSGAAEHPSIVMKVISGPHTGKRFEFGMRETFVVGRSPTSHLVLTDDPHFSRYHFRLEVRPPECYLVDLESRNGTYVNGNQVSECHLKHGDIISVGKTNIEVAITENGPRSSDVAATVIPEPGSEDQAERDATSWTRVESTESSQSVPGYTIVEQLGQGMMGTVHRAIQKSTGREVAIKLIIPNRGGSEKETQMFLREASILSQLDHPRIVRFHELGMIAGQFFIVMDYVPTIDFGRLIAKQKPESRVRIPCAIVCQILDALTYAHSLSIIHRDIKPANILLSKPHGKLKCRLADFGLAKNYTNAGFSEITNDGDARGTVAFMPPEQLLDCRYAKPAADIYATGATLYRFLSGSHAFEFSDRRNAVAQVLQDEITPLGERCPELPSALIQVVHCAMEKDPDKRFTSAQEMYEALVPFSKRNK